jgi:thiazole synthase
MNTNDVIDRVSEAETLSITVNGEPRRIAAGVTVNDLLESLGLHPRLIVVEYNRDILPREQYGQTEVRAGDNFELVHFVGGG